MVRLRVNIPDRRASRWWTLFAVAALFEAGCTGTFTGVTPPPDTETLRGTDSAGATIEIEKRGELFLRARVIDVVLGAGEAPATISGNGRVQFTIGFPAGATISYEGSFADPDSGSPALVGTWVQHSGGIFGPDRGTWTATSVER